MGWIKTTIESFAINDQDMYDRKVHIVVFHIQDSKDSNV